MQTAKSTLPALARLLPTLVVATAMALATGTVSPARAADTTATLKERLSDKASDDQRVDNCRVPAERRGEKPRPDCKVPAHAKAPTRTRAPAGT